MADSVVELGGNTSSSSEVVPSAESTMTVCLDDSQYAEICRYMSTQLYVALAIFSAVCLCLGVLIAHQVLNRWGVR